MHHYPLGWSRLDWQMVTVGIIAAYFVVLYFVLKFRGAKNSGSSTQKHHDYRGSFP